MSKATGSPLGLCSEALHEVVSAPERRTPFYLYRAREAVRRYEKLRSLLGTELYVSLKANPNERILDALSGVVDGVEVASAGELQTALAVRVPCVLTTPVMPDALFRAARQGSCSITFDSLTQLSLALSAAPELHTDVLVRVNAADALRGLGCPVGKDQFGMSVQDACRAAELLASAGIRLGGLHIFAGSHTFPALGAHIPSVLGPLAHRLRGAVDPGAFTVNLGGGFPPDWEEDEELLVSYEQTLKDVAPFRCRHESGRAIFSNAGVYVTTVVATKQIGNEHVVVCDGGLSTNFLLARTESVLRRYLRPIHIAMSAAQRPGGLVKVVGSSCNSNDVLFVSGDFEALPKEGDRLCFAGCGAYSETYSPIRFLSLPPANTYVI